MPPSQPSQPVIIPFENKTLSRITWNLTNQTADAGPDYIEVGIENLSGFPMHLGPSVRELIFDTEPGGNYFVTITAHNKDGSASSQVANLILKPEGIVLVRIW